ncbi:MAG: M14 family zinc carboxypeptidase, partial [bacterium]
MLVLIALAIAISDSTKEMKVKVFCTRANLPLVAEDVLEFYEVNDDYFIGAVTEASYRKFLNSGFRVEVLVADMQEWARLQCPGEDFGRYHSYQEIMDTFALIATTYPNICQLETIAVSPTGKFLLALKVTQNPTQENHRPRLEWDGTIHGNENIGTEICWYIARRLTEGYGSDPLITHLVNTREIWILPCMNPEGLINVRRVNSNDIDLNRDFGYAWNQESGALVPWSQPEIQGYRNFLQSRPFVITMTYHSGTQSVMWPWSYSQIATWDSVAHAQLCQLYGSITGYPAFQISRGLYVCYGTSSDFTYGAEGALGLAAEVAGGQPPPENEIDTICRANWTASLQLMIRGGWGIRGQITDSVTGLSVKRALVVPVPTNWMVYTDTTGWFFKYLLPGTYTLKVMADGYRTKTISGIVVPSDTFVVVDVALAPDPDSVITGYKVTTWICRSASGAGSTMGLNALSRRDNSTLSLTSRGMVVIELSNKVVNGTGTDFFVYSTSNKPCSVFVSNGWNGPWSFCAYGNGNLACDLARAGVSVARFVRLSDAGQNYDLDAIEGLEVNAPALVFHHKSVIDSPPGGNGDGKLDPGESASLVVGLQNAGRVGVTGLTGVLRSSSPFVSIPDSLGTFGDILPDSVCTNSEDRFLLFALPATPREHQAEMKLYLTGTGYADSISFTITVGEIRTVDPIPDNGNPVVYWSYDEIDTIYLEHPQFSWVEVRNLGTRLTLSDDQTVQVNLPPSFGP